MQVGDLRPEEAARLFKAVDPAPNEDIGKNGGDSELIGELFDDRQMVGGTIGFGKFPAV